MHKKVLEAVSQLLQRGGVRDVEMTELTYWDIMAFMALSQAVSLHRIADSVEKHGGGTKSSGLNADDLHELSRRGR